MRGWSRLILLDILAGKRIVLGVTGSIACYKLVDVARHLTQAGALVDVIMTHEATHFVAPLLFESLTYRPVFTDMWSRLENAAAHIKLGDEADIVLIAPATAHTIARLATGMADDILGTTVLATRAPIMLAPAMETKMYSNAATQANMTILRSRGFHILEPDEGLLASGVVGKGRLPDAAVIEGELRAFYGRHAGRLRECKVVVTAGGTREALDPVRYIGNGSSGQMGHALAVAARDEGADVTLINGAGAVAPPAAVKVVNVVSAEDMRVAVEKETEGAHLLIMATAVADYRPAQQATQKIKKSSETLRIELEPTTDILLSLAERNDMVRVGFAAETEQLLAAARAKMQRKKLDLIVANDAVASIGAAHTEVTLIDSSGMVHPLPPGPKTEVASAIIEVIWQRFGARLKGERQDTQERHKA